MRVLIPSYAAGSIIGKGGQTIVQLQKETGATIKLSKSKDFYPAFIGRPVGMNDLVRSIVVAQCWNAAGFDFEKTKHLFFIVDLSLHPAGPVISALTGSDEKYNRCVDIFLRITQNRNSAIETITDEFREVKFPVFSSKFRVLGGFLGFSLSPYFSYFPPFFTFHLVKHLDVEGEEPSSTAIPINVVADGRNGTAPSVSWPCADAVSLTCLSDHRLIYMLGKTVVAFFFIVLRLVLDIIVFKSVCKSRMTVFIPPSVKRWVCGLLDSHVKCANCKSNREKVKYTKGNLKSLTTPLVAASEFPSTCHTVMQLAKGNPSGVVGRVFMIVVFVPPSSQMIMYLNGNCGLPVVQKNQKDPANGYLCWCKRCSQSACYGQKKQAHRYVSMAKLLSFSFFPVTRKKFCGWRKREEQRDGDCSLPPPHPQHVHLQGSSAADLEKLYEHTWFSENIYMPISTMDFVIIEHKHSFWVYLMYRAPSKTAEIAKDPLATEQRQVQRSRCLSGVFSMQVFVVSGAVPALGMSWGWPETRAEPCLPVLCAEAEGNTCISCIDQPAAHRSV
ncbi:hypothetical protein EK904_010161 [Melospiza melodia maxima]|nr:hypothetical protein EK904_010161 [Melospiza melodia maxima]